MSPFRDDDTAVLARAVAAIGAPGFPGALLAALNTLCGAQLCSAFVVKAAGAPTVLVAEGDVPDFPAFAQQATLAYAREFWRSDRAVRRLGEAALADRVSVFRTTPSGLPDRRHRIACYDRAGIGERLSLYRPGALAYLANGYRMRGAGAFSSDDIARVEAAAPILLSAVARHAEWEARQSSDSALSDTIRMLIAAEAGLSGREAQVAAGLIHGRAQKEIGADMGLALSSIVTYRRRAYQKLGVENRRRLLQRYHELRGGGGSGALI